MPVLTQTDSPPPFPPALFVATLVAAAALVVLAFYAMRGATLFGLDPAAVRASASIAAVAFFSCIAYGAWRARRAR